MTVTLSKPPRMPDGRGLPLDINRFFQQIMQWLTENLQAIVTADTDVSAVNARVDDVEADITAHDSRIDARVIGPASATTMGVMLYDGATGKAAKAAGVQSLSGAGAINVTTRVTKWTTTGAQAGTLADGSEGQEKIIVMIVDGGDGTLTPSNLANLTTITFNDVGDSVILVFLGAEWWVVANNGCTLA